LSRSTVTSDRSHRRQRVRLGRPDDEIPAGEPEFKYLRFIGCLGLVALLAHAIAGQDTPNVRAGTLASYHQTHQTIAQINQTIAKYGGDKP
jgi:hypothetical protein